MTAPKLYPRTALVLLTALNLLNYVDRSVLNAVQPLIQSEFRVSDAQIGRLTTVFLIFYTLAAPLMGPLADRYSRRLIIGLGAFAWSGATLLTAVTHSYNALLIRHTLVGVGEASFVTISPTVVADLYPESMRGRVLGFFYLAIPVGFALGYPIGGYFGTHYGWRAPFLLAGFPGFLLGAIVMLMPEPPRGQFDSLQETPERGTVLGLVRNPAFLTATLGMAMMTFAQGGLLVWMPTFLSRMRGYSLLKANNLFGIIIAIDGTIASLLGGWLGDRLMRRTRSAYYLVSAASMGLGIPVMMVALFNRGPAMIPGIALAGFLLLLNTAPLNAAVINSVGSHIRATAIAVNLFVIHFLGDAFSPWLIGKVSDRSSLESGFISTVVATAISSAVLFYGMRFAPQVKLGEKLAEAKT
ncbi:MAG TPA: MFS transporter [Candidatus Sulfotelmatobacter sp.]|nr:MFS transporter [Candidatus Sulfotelmatobacter sp.]